MLIEGIFHKKDALKSMVKCWIPNFYLIGLETLWLIRGCPKIGIGDLVACFVV